MLIQVRRNLARARHLAEGIARSLPGLKQGYSTWIYYRGLT
jgi:hypothetical protein